MLNITWVSLHPHEISLKDIDQVAKTSFPLCMRHLFDKLEEDHHLKHGGRMQLGLFLKVQTNRKRDFVYIVIPMWPKGVPSSTTMQQILFWQVEVSTTGIQLHQQMRCSSSYCHESSRHGVDSDDDIDSDYAEFLRTYDPEEDYSDSKFQTPILTDPSTAADTEVLKKEEAEPKEAVESK
ncbi:phospholipase D delta [Trifolium repens]|nr:phospholipase D delta [Trifolium repens]